MNTTANTNVVSQVQESSSLVSGAEAINPQARAIATGGGTQQSSQYAFSQAGAGNQSIYTKNSRQQISNFQLARKNINLQSADSSKFQDKAQTTISSHAIRPHIGLGGASDGFVSDPSLAYPGVGATSNQYAKDQFSVLSDPQGIPYVTSTTIADTNA